MFDDQKADLMRLRELRLFEFDLILFLLFFPAPEGFSSHEIIL